MAQNTASNYEGTHRCMNCGVKFKTVNVTAETCAECERANELY